MRLILPILILSLLSACGVTPAAPTATPTMTVTASPVPPSATATEAMTPTPQVDQSYNSLKSMLEEQSVPYIIQDGKIAVDDYTTSSVDKITLSPESGKIITTDDGVNPNILTAQDSEGSLYAYNPEHGWFKVPEVYNPVMDIDWEKVDKDSDTATETPYLKEVNEKLFTENYPVVKEDFFTDGRYNITASLWYNSLPEDKKIPDNAAKAIYWVDYAYYGHALGVASGLGGNGGPYAFNNYNQDYIDSYYRPGIPPPFLFNSLWKVELDGDGYTYVVGTTQRNPSQDNPDRLINLANSVDGQGFEESSHVIGGSGRSGNLGTIGGLIHGSTLLNIYLEPPAELDGGIIAPSPLKYDKNFFWFGPNDVIGDRQVPGELIGLFPPEDQEKIMDVLLTGVNSPKVISKSEPLKYGLPEELANRILYIRVGTR